MIRRPMFDLQRSLASIPCESLASSIAAVLTTPMKRPINCGPQFPDPKPALRRNQTLPPSARPERTRSGQKLISNRYTYEKLEPRLTRTKQSLGPRSNRLFFRFFAPSSAPKLAEFLIGTQTASDFSSTPRKISNLPFSNRDKFQLFYAALARIPLLHQIHRTLGGMA